MMSIHAVLLVASLCCLAAATAARRRDGQAVPRSRSPLALTVVGAALALGNAVCLLPQAPRWYSIAVVLFSVGAVVLLLLTSPRATPAAPERARRHLPLYAVGSPTSPVEAEIVEDLDAPADPFRNVVSIIREQERVVVTQPMLHSAGPRGSHTTVGQGSYVAAHLRDYLGEDRASGARTRTRRIRPVVTSDDAAKRLRVLRAYSDDGDRRGRMTSRLS